MRTLILGIQKSGTSALYWHLQSVMEGDVKCLYEPKVFDGKSFAPDTDVLAKVLIWGTDTDFESFACFDRKILIVRDPRDRLISSILFNVLHFYRSTEAVRKFLGLLRRKEKCPSSVTFCELLRWFDTCFGIETGFLQWHHEMQDLEASLQERFSDMITVKYRDVLNRHVHGLEDHLGATFGGDVHDIDPPRGLQQVARSKMYDNWRRWFCPEDESELSSLVNPYLLRHDYEVDWILSPVSRLDPYKSSRYIIQHINTYRENAQLLPIGLRNRITRRISRLGSWASKSRLLGRHYAQMQAAMIGLFGRRQQMSLRWTYGRLKEPQDENGSQYTADISGRSHIQISGLIAFPGEMVRQPHVYLRIRNKAFRAELKGLSDGELDQHETGAMSRLFEASIPQEVL